MFDTQAVCKVLLALAVCFTTVNLTCLIWVRCLYGSGSLITLSVKALELLLWIVLLCLAIIPSNVWFLVAATAIGIYSYEVILLREIEYTGS